MLTLKIFYDLMLKKLVSLNLEKKKQYDWSCIQKYLQRKEAKREEIYTCEFFFLTFGNRDNSNLLYFIFYNF